MRVLIFCLIVTMISCGDNTAKAIEPTINYSDLLGHWDIDSATRNGKETNTLADSYMYFRSTSELNTNIFGSEMTQAIIWSDSTAMVSDSSMLYKIHTITTDSLYISFSLQRHLFQLSFLKKYEEELPRNDQTL